MPKSKNIHYKYYHHSGEEGEDLNSFILIPCEILFWGTKIEWQFVATMGTELPIAVTVCFVRDIKTGEVVAVYPQQLQYEAEEI